MHGTERTAAPVVEVVPQTHGIPDTRGTAGTAPGDEDPRVAELRTAVAGLRRELASHRAEFADRSIAENELAILAATAGAPDAALLRRSLLLIAAAVGSVSALAVSLAQLRAAIEMFGPGAAPSR